MGVTFDFYGTLLDLLRQIPEGMSTTARDLADALGDPRASRAVMDYIKGDEFQFAVGRVMERKDAKFPMFRDFKSDKPLKKLAEIQKKMAKKVVREDTFSSAEVIAGTDVAYDSNRAYAYCFVLDRLNNVIDSGSAVVEVDFPYIPGYLTFREAPVIEAAVRHVVDFDVLMVNGHGVAHPRGCGLASYVGLDLDVPTIGIASRRLVGRVGSKADGWTPLIYRGQVVGGRVGFDEGQSIYVSIGHMISLETSIRIVQATRVHGRLPEPIRLAHMAAEALRRGCGSPSP